jgi:hypothetical protein
MNDTAKDPGYSDSKGHKKSGQQASFKIMD